MQTDLLRLLKNKNRCLEKFLEVSIDFLSDEKIQKRVQNPENNLVEIESFEKDREAILKAITIFDQKIEKSVLLIEEKDRTSNLIESVKNLLSYRDDLIREIIRVDSKIISSIEEQQLQMKEEITKSKKGKKAISKFKSRWVKDRGKELDQEL